MRDAHAGRLRRDLHAHDHVVGDLVLHPAVKALRILAHDDEVHAAEARRDAGEVAHRANRGVQDQPPAQLDVDRREAFADRRRARPLERHPVMLDEVERLLRQHLAALRQRRQPGLTLHPFHRRTRFGQDALGRIGDLGTDPIARNQHDRVLRHRFLPPVARRGY